MVSSDRVFFNRKTQGIIISANDGMMGRGVMANHPDWMYLGRVFSFLFYLGTALTR